MCMCRLCFSTTAIVVCWPVPLCGGCFGVVFFGSAYCVRVLVCPLCFCQR